MARRTWAELRFRLQQELANLYFLVAQPGAVAGEAAPLAGLPDPEAVAHALRGTAYAAAVVEQAEEILAGRYRLLGLELDFSSGLRWRRDALSGRETGLDYFRRIPYLQPEVAGDHKVIWELNRHQHWVLLAQAWRLTGRQEFWEEIERQWRDWVNENPFQRGVNWTSALEVGFRAMSWVWVYHLAGGEMATGEMATGEKHGGMREDFLRGLHQHGLHLERNLSIYFSPNTHLLGEALALEMLGLLFPSWQEAKRWSALGKHWVEAAMEKQVLDDGVYFELSSYYHVYAFDMFLLHGVLTGDDVGIEYRAKLEKMGVFLDALLGAGRRIPLIGDDDGGRLFHPYGVRREFGRASLAAGAIWGGWNWGYGAGDVPEMAAWWLGEAALEHKGQSGREPVSLHFANAGLFVLRSGELSVIVDAGPFGPFRGGHSHADALSVLLCSGAEDLLVDAGTYTYVGSAAWRERFRATAMHNTVVVEGQEQAQGAGPFGWKGMARVKAEEWSFGAEADEVVALCELAGVMQRRRLRFLKREQVLEVEDVIEGKDEFSAELFWHLGAGAEAKMRITADGTFTVEQGGQWGWQSEALGDKRSGVVLRLPRRSQGARVSFRTRIEIGKI